MTEKLRLGEKLIRSLMKDKSICHSPSFQKWTFSYFGFIAENKTRQIGIDGQR